MLTLVYAHIAYENRIRDQKMRMEMTQAKRENDEYLERVEQSKKFDKMDERKAAKAATANGNSSNTTTKTDDAMQQIRRTFSQKAPADSKKRMSLRDDDALLEKVFSTAAKSKKQKTQA